MGNVKQTIEVGKERVLPTRVIQDLEKIINKFNAGETMYTKNFTETRTLDIDSATLGDMGNYLCTLVNELKKKGIIRG